MLKIFIAIQLVETSVSLRKYLDVIVIFCLPVRRGTETAPQVSSKFSEAIVFSAFIFD